MIESNSNSDSWEARAAALDTCRAKVHSYVIEDNHQSLIRLDEHVSALGNDTSRTLSQVFGTSTLYTEGTLILCTPGQWITLRPLMRVLLETTARFVYLADADRSTRDQRARDYSGPLADVSKLEQHNRASKAANHARDEPWAALSLSLRQIPHREVERIKKSMPRDKDRRNVTQRWSFGTIVFQLAQQADAADAAMWKRVGSEYDMGSRATHCDPNFVFDAQHIYSTPEPVRDTMLWCGAWTALEDIMLLSITRHRAMQRMFVSIGIQSTPLPSALSGLLDLVVHTAALWRLRCAKQLNLSLPPEASTT